MGKPTFAFVLALTGGALNMLYAVYPLSFFGSGLFVDTPFIGLVVISASVGLHEMPDRHATFGAVITVLSLVGFLFQLFLETPRNVYLWIPVVGSQMALVGGVRGLYWKPSVVEKM